MESRAHRRSLPGIGSALSASPSAATSRYCWPGPIIPLAAWWSKSPVEIFLRFGLEACVVQQISERNQAIQEIRPAFPGLARTAQPAAVGANIGPCLIQMAAEAVCLNLQLSRAIPWGERTQRKQIKSVRRQRSRVLDNQQRNPVIGGFAEDLPAKTMGERNGREAIATEPACFRKRRRLVKIRSSWLFQSICDEPPDRRY